MGSARRRIEGTMARLLIRCVLVGLCLGMLTVTAEAYLGAPSGPFFVPSHPYYTPRPGPFFISPSGPYFPAPATPYFTLPSTPYFTPPSGYYFPSPTAPYYVPPTTPFYMPAW